MCTYNICHSINECFSPSTFFFHKLLNYFLMFPCNEHVEMNKLLCSLACTWSANFISLTALSLDVSLG